ncbi:hypothetical protein NPIL_487781 [Nephila pilipes]|uniref:Uncharacterized protein n=1 Tax=Nephila pilipes TaxID=299642 RepID=A0A8X6TEI5_NEPPI|nr:hypothetical protein NPIL_487781 [Nephila pilipes]
MWLAASVQPVNEDESLEHYPTQDSSRLKFKFQAYTRIEENWSFSIPWEFRVKLQANDVKYVKSLISRISCHTQSVEQCVKLVTAGICGATKTDGFIKSQKWNIDNLCLILTSKQNIVNNEFFSPRDGIKPDRSSLQGGLANDFCVKI